MGGDINLAAQNPVIARSQAVVMGDRKFPVHLPQLFCAAFPKENFDGQRVKG
jgi:hypothetical protein